MNFKRIIGVVTLVPVCLVGSVQAQSYIPANAAWHLQSDTDCIGCLNAKLVWDQYGTGRNDIRIMLLESSHISESVVDINTHPWLEHQSIPVYYTGQSTPQPRKGPTIKARANTQICELQKKLNKFPSQCATLINPEISNSAKFADWHAGQNHALRMIGLIAGKDNTIDGYQSVVGFAPDVSVSLTYLNIAQILNYGPETISLDDKISKNRQLLNKLSRFPSDTKVVSYAASANSSDSIDNHYMRMSEYASLLSAVYGDEIPLILASAGNHGSTREITFQRNFGRIPDGIPIEFSLTNTALLNEVIAATDISDRYPHITSALPRSVSPLVIVGGIEINGKPFADRSEDFIDLYAPSGTLLNRNTSLSERNKLLYDTHTNYKLSKLNTVTLRNWLPTLDVVPVNEESTAIEDDYTFSPVQGTSASVTLVAALAGLMFSIDPNMPASVAKEILIKTADRNNAHRLPIVSPSSALREVSAKLALKVTNMFLRQVSNELQNSTNWPKHINYLITDKKRQTNAQLTIYQFSKILKRYKSPELPLDRTTATANACVERPEIDMANNGLYFRSNKQASLPLQTNVSFIVVDEAGNYKDIAIGTTLTTLYKQSKYEYHISNINVTITDTKRSWVCNES